MWLITKPAWCTGMSTVSLHRYSPRGRFFFFFFEPTTATGGITASLFRALSEWAGHRASCGAIRPCISERGRTPPRPPPRPDHRRPPTVVTDSATARRPSVLAGMHLPHLFRASACRLAPWSLLSEARWGPYPPHFFLTTCIVRACRISPKAALAKAISAAHSWAFVWSPRGNGRPEPRQPYLPKLPSEAACVCLSPPNILSPFGLAWRKKRRGKKQKTNQKQGAENGGTREDADAGEKREGVGDDGRRHEKMRLVRQAGERD